MSFLVERKTKITTKIVDKILIKLQINELVLDLPESTAPKFETLSAKEPKLQYKIVPGKIPIILGKGYLWPTDKFNTADGERLSQTTRDGRWFQSISCACSR